MSSQWVFTGSPGAKLDLFVLAPPAPNSVLKKFILVLRFLDFLFFFAGASGAQLDESGPALRYALNVFLQVPLVPNTFCFAGAFGTRLDA